MRLQWRLFISMSQHTDGCGAAVGQYLSSGGHHLHWHHLRQDHGRHGHRHGHHFGRDYHFRGCHPSHNFGRDHLWRHHLTTRSPPSQHWARTAAPLGLPERRKAGVPAEGRQQLLTARLARRRGRQGPTSPEGVSCLPPALPAGPAWQPTISASHQGPPLAARPPGSSLSVPCCVIPCPHARQDNAHPSPR